jgi:hypothetical protein
MRSSLRGASISPLLNSMVDKTKREWVEALRLAKGVRRAYAERSAVVSAVPMCASAVENATKIAIAAGLGAATLCVAVAGSAAATECVPATGIDVATEPAATTGCAAITEHAA